MLSEGEKTDSRRYLGYPVHGSGASGNMGWQFYQAYGAMEWRLVNLSSTEETVLRRYLGTLATLEVAIPGSSAGLDTESAAGWVRNAGEVSERVRLFDDWRRRFCSFLGLPPGPGLGDASSSSVRLVV
jgi:hypothetical protein